MSFPAMVRKELGDLAREKRFGVWAILFLAFWSIFLFFFLAESVGPSAFYRQDNPRSIAMLEEVAFFFYAMAFGVLGLFLLSDGITKERESGMLPVVGAKPIVRWHVPLAKLLAGLAVYAATFVLTLIPASVLAAAMGFAVIEMMALLYVGPFLALYVFLLGLGLLLGVVSSSSKVAIGSAAALYVPLFFMMRDGPLQLLYGAYPNLERILAYTPFEVTFEAVRVLVVGGVMPWAGLALVAGLGVAAGGAGFWLFTRQEVAQ